jgi:hypothetical protein
MSHRFPQALIGVIFGLLFAANASATTYYIASNGSDSNSAANASISCQNNASCSPWAHYPGDPNATGSSASYYNHIQPGDVFILRGCDTWTVTGPWGYPGVANTSGAHGKIGGFDQTFYNTTACPSAWNRPILTGNGTYPGSTQDGFFHMGNGGTAYLEVGFIEWTGLYWGVNITGQMFYINCNTASNSFVHDNYAHGWSHAANVIEDAGAGFFYCGSGRNNAVYNNYIDGSDTTNTCSGVSFCGSFVFVYGGGENDVYENFVQYVGIGLDVTAFKFHDNTVQYSGMNPYAGDTTHNDVFESITDVPGGILVYNNLFANNGSQSSGACNVGIQFSPQPGSTSYGFNNVWANGYDCNDTGLAATPTSPPGGGTVALFNNTVECGTDSIGPNWPCLLIGDPGSSCPTGTLQGNHWITSAAAPATGKGSCSSGGTFTSSAQTIKTLTQAKAGGYSLTRTYPFAPTSGSGYTVGAGISASTLSSLCSAISAMDSSAGTACLSDTSAGVAIDTTTHTVTGLLRTPIVRYTTGTEDAGAYQFSSSATPPNPPSGLAAIVQ